MIDTEILEKKLSSLELEYKTKMKKLNDEIQDLREMREADSLINNIKLMGESIEKYLTDMQRLKLKVEELMKEEITDIDLFEAWKRSGATLKEVAQYLNMDTIQLTSVSKLMNGKMQDKNKRLIAYNYCLMKIARTKDFLEQKNDL